MQRHRLARDFVVGYDLRIDFVGVGMRIFGALAVTVALAGCSTAPITVERAKSVPQERIYFVGEEGQQSSSTLVVVRDRGATGSACFINLWINGKIAAQFDPEEKAVFKILPGGHILGTQIQKTGLCGIGQGLIEREVVIAPGEVKYYRIFTSANAEVDLLPSAYVGGQYEK